jgi:hypothetical protein
MNGRGKKEKMFGLENKGKNPNHKRRHSFAALFLSIDIDSLQ